jgi:vancomycin resistance protein VanJ
MSMSDHGPRRYRMADYAVSPASPPASRPSLRVGRKIVSAGCWLYGLIVVGVWGLVNWSSHEFWPSHMFLYGPRWLVCLPALLLVPIVTRLRLWCSALPLGLAVLSFFGIWEFNVPWPSPVPQGDESRQSLRLLTCNVQRSDLRTNVLASLIRQVRPDVVLLEECNLVDPHIVLGDDEWDVRTAGEFCLASRYPIADFESLTRPDKSYRIVAVRATVSWEARTIPVVAVHLMTPRRGLEAIINSPSHGVSALREIFAVQQFESGLLRRWVEEFSGSILLAGDFNLTIQHALFRRDWSEYTDAFARTSWGLGHTMFTRHIGLRIDHILCGSDWRPTRCWVGPDVGSAHRPLIADLIGGDSMAVRTSHKVYPTGSGDAGHPLTTQATCSAVEPSPLAALPPMCLDSNL